MAPSPTLEKRGFILGSSTRQFISSVLRRGDLRACEHHQDKDFVAFRVEVHWFSFRDACHAN